MTTAQLNHLRRIDAHLANLLLTAEKRTPGSWGCVNSPLGGTSEQDEHDERFVEACAGNAEAGWRATRSLIDYLLMMHKHGDGYRYVGLTEDILAAFPNV